MMKIWLPLLLLASCAAAQTPADLFLDFEAGTAGDLWTTANLATATHGAALGTWTIFQPVSGGPLNHTTVNATNQARRTSFLVNGVTYTGTGTRCVKFDMAGHPAYDGFRWSPPASFTDLTLSGVSYFAVGGGTPNFDHMHIAGGSYVVMQQAYGGLGGTQGELHAETQIGGVTYKSAPIFIDTGWYEWHMRFKGSDGSVGLVIINPSTGALIGTSGMTGTDVAGPVVRVDMQDYNDPQAGYALHDNIAFAWGAKALLPLDESFVSPPPTLVNLTQTASGVVRLLWRGLGLAYLIERRTGAGSWGTLATYWPGAGGTSLMQYLDSTASDATAYQYRISTIIGDYTSTPTTSAAFTTDNLPDGEQSVYASQTGSSGSVSITESGVLTQRIKNTSAVPLRVCEVTLDTEFFSRGNPEVLFLTENNDGTGTLYGVSNAVDIEASGPVVFPFFTPAAVPAGTDFFLFYNPVWTRTQFFHVSDAGGYLPGQGYNLRANGADTISGEAKDLKFTIKQSTLAPFGARRVGFRSGGMRLIQ